MEGHVGWLGEVVPGRHVSEAECGVVIFAFVFVRDETISVYDLLRDLLEDLRLLVPEGLFLLSLLLLHPLLFFFEESEFQLLANPITFWPCALFALPQWPDQYGDAFRCWPFLLFLWLWLLLFFFFSFLLWLISFFKVDTQGLRLSSNFEKSQIMNLRAT